MLQKTDHNHDADVVRIEALKVKEGRKCFI